MLLTNNISIHAKTHSDGTLVAEELSCCMFVCVQVHLKELEYHGYNFFSVTEFKKWNFHKCHIRLKTQGQILQAVFLFKCSSLYVCTQTCNHNAHTKCDSVCAGCLVPHHCPHYLWSIAPCTHSTNITSPYAHTHTHTHTHTNTHTHTHTHTHTYAHTHTSTHTLTF